MPFVTLVFGFILGALVAVFAIKNNRALLDKWIAKIDAARTILGK